MSTISGVFFLPVTGSRSSKQQRSYLGSITASARLQRVSINAAAVDQQSSAALKRDYYESVKKTTDEEFFLNDSRPIMLFDAVCNLCNGGVRFVRSIDPKRRIRYEALQSESGRKLLMRSGRAPDDISTVVLVDNDRSYIKSDAVLKIMEYLDLPFPQLAFVLKFVPLFLRDFAYDNVANNRYNIFGRTDPDSCV